MGKSVVSIAKGDSADQMVEEALSLLGGVTTLIKPGSVVVLKPNAGHPFGPDTSVNTSPGLLTAVIRAVRKADPREIIVAEAAAVGCDTQECFEISGIGKAARDAGADKLIDIKREKDLINIPIRDARSAMTRVLLPRWLIEADHIINIPIFKTHVAMVFTCALKNLKGVVQDKVHRQMHQTVLADAMMDLWSVVRADLNIVDMIRPAEGFGPHNTMPVDFGCVVASRDPVAADATVCRMVGLDINQVPYFGPARERNLGSFAEDAIEVRGKTIDEVFQQLWLPYLDVFGNKWQEYNIQSQGACSSCQGLLAYTMERLKAIGEYDKNAGMTILVGPKREIPPGIKKEDLLLFGDCVKKWRAHGIFVQGCPPNEGSPLFSILNRLDDEKRAEIPKNMATEAEKTRKFREHMMREKEKAAKARAGKK